MIARLALLLLLLLASPAHAAIAHVQTVTCASHGATSCTTASMTTTTGNLFVASVGWAYKSFTAFSSITDNKSNTFANAVPDSTDTASVEYNSRQEYVANAAGGSGHTFTATITVAYFVTVAVSEISGAATSPLDKTASGSDGNGTSHSAASTATTTQAAELLVGSATNGDAGITLGCASGGWTERGNVAYDDSVTQSVIACTRVVAATAAYAFAFTSSGLSRTASSISTWKEAAAAAGTRQRCVGCGADGKVIE